MQRFWCVYSFSSFRRDFEIVGVFTRQEDAAAHLAALGSEAEKSCGACVARTWAEISDELVKERLGALAEPLNAILDLVKKSIPDDARAALVRAIGANERSR